jgi:hypothetical protein
LPNKWKFNGVSSKSQWFLNLVTMVLHMEFKLKTKGFSMDIKFFFNWVFYGVSIEKKNPRRQSPQGKLLFFLFFFKHLTEIITGMFL